MTEYQYIIDSDNLKIKYDRITAIISALEEQQLLVVSNSGVVSYSLDDGQTRIQTTYRSSDQIAKAINEYEKIRNRILAEITGTRIMRLADAGTIQSNKFRRIQ
jgi:hypothetical protein